MESSVRKIFFTGSVEVGRKVGATCSERLKGSVLELGGKDPMLVLADADLENAISGALWGGFANAGQTCAGIERIYVAREVAERFTEGVVAGAKALRVGGPLDWHTEIGPMVRATSTPTWTAWSRTPSPPAPSCTAAAVIQPEGLSGSFYRADRPHQRQPRDAHHA